MENSKNSKEKAKKNHFQIKLQLKQFPKESSETKTDKNNVASSERNVDDKNVDLLLSDDDEEFQKPTNDTLKDFKSPTGKCSNKFTLNKFKTGSGNGKKKLFSSRSKSTSNKSQKIDNQPSIESSFFKSPSIKEPEVNNDVKNAFQCPICLKPFKEEMMCTVHMKSCATKNKVSFQQLMQAKELLSRQTEERKAMGLIAAPILSDRKKTTRPRKNDDFNDPQFQLGLAISKSLHEAEQMEFEEAALLAGIPESCVQELSEEDKKMSLTDFGFTTNKPIEEVSVKNKKKKLLGPTILETRSQEEKNRILTERIACILTGDDALTQTQSIDNSPRTTIKKSVISSFLQEIQNKDNCLWKMSRLTKIMSNFYVKSLNHFLLSDKDNGQDSKILSNSSTDSLVYDPIEIPIQIEDNVQKCDSGFSEFSEVQPVNEQNFYKNVILNWRESVNSSIGSDVIIFVKGNIIYAHKLVFQIQCPEILLQIEMNNLKLSTEFKEKINWESVDKCPALGFLEFIYCGNIDKYKDSIKNSDFLSQIRDLARIYKVKNLFSYLWKICDKTNGLDNCQHNKQSVKSIEINKMPVTISQIEDNQVDLINVYKDKISSPRDLLHKNILNNFRRSTVSPDLFESDYEIENESIHSKSEAKQSNNIYPLYSTTISDNNTQLKLLVDLIDIDEEIVPNLEISTINDIVKNQTSNESTAVESSCGKKKIIENMEYKNSNFSNSTKTALEFENFSFEEYEESVRNNSDLAAKKNTNCNTRSLFSKTQSENNITFRKPKLKSEISLFIEKIQRQNARSLLESDSDCDSPILSKPRNPFSKHLHDDSVSSRFHANKTKAHRKGISILEQEILKTALKDKVYEEYDTESHELSQKKKNSMLNCTSSNLDCSNTVHNSGIAGNDQIDNQFTKDISLEEMNETDMSMYSKYKKTHKDNSIVKYREALKLIDSEPSTSIDSNLQQSEKELDRRESNKEIEDITLVSDSDTEINFSIPITQHDSPGKSFKIPSETQDNYNNLDIELQESFQLDNMLVEEKNDVIEITDSDENNSQKRNNSEKKIHFSSENGEFSAKVNIDNGENELSKVLMTSQEFSNEIEDLLRELKKDQSQKTVSEGPINKSNTPEIMNLSPISIASSPENCNLMNPKTLSDNENYSQLNSNRKEGHYSKKNITEPLLEEKEFFIAYHSSPTHSMNEPVPLEKYEQITSLISSPIISKKKPSQMSKLHKTNRGPLDCPSEAKSRKLNIRSKSEKCLQSEELSKSNNVFQRSLSFVTPPQRANQSNARTDSEEVTPCPNYSIMETPTLMKELNKFGLKHQDRRKAKLLLTHIYDETHPLVPRKRLPSASDTEDEPPLKKQTLDKSSVLKNPGNANSEILHIENESSSQNSTSLENDEYSQKYIPEELDLDQETFSDNYNFSDIKKVFKKLLDDDKDLSNKVLTYAPLQLEDIHRTLKSQGVKCKVSELMSFLDEECITFQIHNNKGNRIKKKQGCK